MQAENISIYGIDCDVFTTLPDIENALKRTKRLDPDLIVFYAPGRLAGGFVDIVKDTYETGVGVMLTANKLTAPGGTNWLKKLAE